MILKSQSLDSIMREKVTTTCCANLICMAFLMKQKQCFSPAELLTQRHLHTDCAFDKHTASFRMVISYLLSHFKMEKEFKRKQKSCYDRQYKINMHASKYDRRCKGIIILPSSPHAVQHLLPTTLHAIKLAHYVASPPSRLAKI